MKKPSPDPIRVIGLIQINAKNQKHCATGLAESLRSPTLASCAFHKHKDFAVEHAVLGEKLWIGFRIDANRCVRMARFNRPNGLTFVRDGDKRPFLQRRSARRIG